MKEEDKKEASTASEAEKPSNEASSASIKTEAMEAEDAGEKSKSEAEAKSKAEASASASAASDGKIKAEAKSVLPSGEAGDGDMDEAAMRRALQVRKFGISVWNSVKLKDLEFGKNIVKLKEDL